MQATLAKYGPRIASGEVDPLRRWDGKSAFLLDAVDDNVPLLVLSFSARRLTSEPVSVNTGDCEHALVLVDGRLRLEAGGRVVEAARAGGPFEGYPGSTRACVVYVPRATRYTLSGDSEVVTFMAHADGDMPLRLVAGDEAEFASRGVAVWRRDVATLIRPGEVSTNLVVGETHSPPGLWSGTPPHRHDLSDPTGSQSDHEEIYYFRIRRYDAAGAPGGVQFLYAEGLNEVYTLADRDVMALPGGCHPVVAGPASELLYVWGMASDRPQPLRLWDIPAAAFLKEVEAAFVDLTGAAARERISLERFEQAAAGLDEHGRRVLRLILREYGFDVQG